MKFIIFLLSTWSYFLVVFGTKEYTFDNCTCIKDYHPHLDADDKAQCYGVKVTDTLPCGFMSYPECKCTKYKYNNVNIFPGYVGYCLYVLRDVTFRRWTCENEEEWIAFRVYMQEEGY